jgi:hypothetical protein
METTNILIPTDFSLASLNAITGLVKKHPEERFNITLVHFFKLADSEAELLMLARRNREYTHISQEFEDQLNELRKSFPQQVARVYIEFFYGNTMAIFKNFLEARDIKTIVCLDCHNYKQLTKNSIDPQLLVKRSGCKLININTTATRPQIDEDVIVITRPQLEIQQI